MCLEHVSVQRNEKTFSFILITSVILFYFCKVHAFHSHARTHTLEFPLISSGSFVLLSAKAFVSYPLPNDA